LADAVHYAAAAGRLWNNSPDWKDGFRAEVLSRFGWAAPKRELRVRTAIDARVRRAAEAELFAYEMILPRDEDGARLEWYGYVDFSALKGDGKEQEEAIADLSDLMRRFGLVLLGKTKACADVLIRRMDTVLPAVEGSMRPLPFRDGKPCWVLTSQSDAVLVDLDALGPTATAKSPHDAYDQVWQQISDKKLRLIDYFAQQKLAGGGYLCHRFLKQSKGADKGYHPVPLTEAGSVFVLAPVDAASLADAQKMIEGFAAKGLPLPAWAQQGYAPRNKDTSSEAELWPTLPYLRQNGCGEVAVNLSVAARNDERPDAQSRAVSDAD